MEAPCFVLLGTMTDRVTQQYSGAAVTGSTWLCLCCCQTLWHAMHCMDLWFPRPTSAVQRQRLDRCLMVPHLLHIFRNQQARTAAP